MKLVVTLLLSFVATIAHCQISPAATAISIGQWVSRNSNSVYHVRVTATGKNSYDARQNGFRKAVELAVGTLVLGESETRNNELIRNDIISYSSGFVDDFKVINETDRSVTMDVWISESKFANRIENMGASNSAAINGQQMKKEWERQIVQEVTSDTRSEQAIRLMDVVLTDYPRAAYKTKITGTALQRSKFGGSPSLVVDVKVEFTETYGDSLLEVLKLTRRGSFSNRWPTVTIKNGFMNYSKAHWENVSTPKQWEETFSRPIYIQVTLGTEKFCHVIPLKNEFMGKFSNGDFWFIIDTQTTVKRELFIQNEPRLGMSDSQFVDWLTTIDKAEVRVVESRQCTP